MNYPWANAILLALIGVESVTGLLGLVTGNPDLAIYIQLHRIAGYGILALLGWKSANVVFSLRGRRNPAPRIASLTLAGTLIVVLGLGYAWSWIGPFGFAWFSGVSWHIYFGVLLAPLVIWHANHLTRRFSIRQWSELRTFLRLAGLGVVGFAAWQVSEQATRLAGFSGANRRFTGSYEAVSYSGNAFPRVSWLNDNPASIEVPTWSLSVIGPSSRRASYTLDELNADAEITATIDCTGGWHSTQQWSGTRLSDLLDDFSSDESVRSVTVRSITGYYRRFSLEDARGMILATSVGGETLSHGHGFPLRLVAPGRRGFEWVKWVTELEVSSTPSWWQPPIPLQ
jgi:hypothetical protein